jgi:post-segregation antitoxin (ccd killing protein)
MKSPIDTLIETLHTHTQLSVNDAYICSRGQEMARVNLYVPDDLLARAQQLRDEGQLSMIFRHALAAEVRRNQWRRQEQADLEAEIDLAALRLRFLADRGACYRAGYKVGLEHAQQTSYAVMRFYESRGWDPEAVVACLPQQVKDALCAVESEQENWRTAELQKTYAAPKQKRTLLSQMMHTPPGFAEGVRLEVHQGCVDALRWVWDRVMDDADDRATAYLA